MRIAMLGIRGVPASYSGFETCAEQLGARLVQRGHEVTVYCRTHHTRQRMASYRGMRLVYLPTLRNKYLDTISHTFLSCLHVALHRHDIVLMFIVGNSPLAILPRLVGMPVVLHVDGLDWKREKWPPLAKRYLRLSERIAMWTPTEVVTDSQSVQEYYMQTYGRRPTFIAYGSDIEGKPSGDYLKRFGLQPRRYILFVGRLVPENCPHHLVEAFRGLDTDMACVIVGDAPYAEEYIRRLRATTDPRVIFTGYLFGDGYRELGANAYAFVETSGVGGTHPALLEAMALGNCVIVNNTKENLETIGDAGLCYPGNLGAAGLRPVLAHVIAHPQIVEEYRQRAAQRAHTHYSWDAITDLYEEMFHRLVTRR